MVSPKLGLRMIKKIYDCSRRAEIAGEPSFAEIIVDWLNFPYAPVLMVFEELGGEDRGYQAIKAGVMKIESRVPHRLISLHSKTSSVDILIVCESSRKQHNFLG